MKTKVFGFSLIGGVSALAVAGLVASGLIFSANSHPTHTSAASPTPSPSSSATKAPDFNGSGEADQGKGADDWEAMQALREKVHVKQPRIAQAVHRDVSKPFRDIKPAKITAAPEEEGNGGERAAEEARAKLLPHAQGGRVVADAARQRTYGASAGGTGTNAGTSAGASTPTAATGWVAQGSGTANAGRYAPPDTNMDVSETQIVQSVNVGLAIWNKDGTVAKAAVPISSLWSGFGGLCQADNDGDATVVYDRMAKRWVISQFALTGATGAASAPFLQCVAVSTTSDATGSYYRYSFAYNYFPDYPKTSVWPDAYYTTFNMFNAAGTAYMGAYVCAYDRVSMLAGLPATQLCAPLNSAYDSILVASIDGQTTPTTGEAAYAVAINTTGTLANWRLAVNWTAATPSLTFTQKPNINITPFTYACNGTGGTCVPQSGTTQTLDTLGDRLMYRFVYRKIGSTESFLVSHTVWSGGTNAIRWYEFRNASPGADLSTTPYQQSTYQPDSTHRFMPAITMDKAGNIGMVYTTSSSTGFPSVRAVGQQNGTDAINTMGSEITIKAGSGSQTTGLSRWGDYAAAVVDPSDDCTIWVSNEYQAANGTFNWSTYISNFKFANCGAVASTYAVSGPASGAVNSASSTFTVTPNGTYTGHVSVAFTGAAVSTTNPTVLTFDGSGTPQTFTVTPTATGTVTMAFTNDGSLTDPSNVTYLAQAAATGYSVSGPTSGFVTKPSTYTITPNGPYAGTVTLTLGGAAATASATSFTFAGATSQTFTVTPSAAGNVTLSFSSSPAITNQSLLTLNAAATPATVTALSTTSGPAGTSITLTGTNFTGTPAVTGVTIGGKSVASFTATSATRMTVVVATGAASGSVVVYKGGVAGPASTPTFTVTNPAATISTATSWINPTSSIRVGSSVTLTGTNLTGVTGVLVGGTKVSAPFRVISATSLVFGVPAGATTGTVQLNYTGGSVTSTRSMTITTGSTVPTVTGLSTRTASAGTTVVITGTNLAGATAVKFGATSASFTVVSATSIIAAAPGTGLVTVTTAGGTSTNTGATTTNTATGTATATIATATPSFGSAGATITLTGTNLAGITAATIKGVAVSSIRVTSVSGTTVTVTLIVPNAVTAGTGNISLTIVGGATVATAAGSFTVY